jgi:hypothetical protein
MDLKTRDNGGDVFVLASSQHAEVLRRYWIRLKAQPENAAICAEISE